MRALARELVPHLVLLPLAVLSLLPFLWMVSTSFKPEGTEFVLPFRWVGDRLAWENYPAAFSSPVIPMARIFANSVGVTAVVVVAHLVTCPMGGYAFARLRFPGRDRLFLLYLATLMVPGQVTLIPNFLVMKLLGWLDSYWALTIPAFTSAFGTFLLRQFFLTIPRELEDAAFVDGASRWAILWRIIVPLSGPAMATLGLFTCLSVWNSFLWPLVVTSSPEMRTLPVAISLFSGTVNYATRWALLMSASIVAILPILVVFLAAQRYFIRGVNLTGFGGT